MSLSILRTPRVRVRAERLPRRGLTAGVSGRDASDSLRPLPRPSLPHCAPSGRARRRGLLARTDLRWESGAEERRGAGEAACGNTGSSREAERGCRVPLDLHRHSAVWEEEGRRCACPRVPDSACTRVYA